MKFSDKFERLNLYKVLDSHKNYLEDEEPEEKAKVNINLKKLNLNVVDNEIQDSTMLNDKGYAKQS